MSGARRSLPLALRARWSRRRLLGTALAAGVAGVAAWGFPSTAARAADAPGGLIALPRGRDIALIRPDGSDDRTIISLGLGEFIADVALSPDATTVAFGMFTSRTGDGPGGSDIVVAPIASPNDRTVVVPRDRPGMLLAAPQWSPDGKALVFEAVGLSATGQATVSAEWVSADGSGRRTLAQMGRYPAFSSDGRTVVYTKSLPSGDALWEQPLDGGDGRELLAESVLLLITYPRYSPDGKTVALAGVGNDAPPVLGAPVMPKLLPSSGADPSRVRDVLAHGYPTSPFAVAAAGADPKLLGQLAVDDGATAWSPDGAYVAISGASGLWLVGAADGSIKRVSETGSFGGIDWR